jgi:putative membrane protein
MGQARNGEAGRREAAGGPRPRALVVVGIGCLAAMVAAQVMSGLQPRPIRLTGVVVVLLAAGALAFLAARHGPPRAVGAFAAVVALGYAAEWIGVRTGLPFGRYSYTPVLRPQVGGVPVVVALAWGGMGLAAHAVATRIVPSGGPARIVTGALALTAWDLFLDPQMLRLGLWEWADPGPYRGVPVSNFLGWLLVSLLVMAVIEAAVGRADTAAAGLAAIYAVMAVMETLAFAAVFEPPDRLVAAAGGLAMGTFAVLAGRRRWPR